MHDYKLIRSSRKTAAIHITGEATVEVRAPLSMPKANIDRFVLAKEKWIDRHLHAKEQQVIQKAGFTISYNEMVLLQGKQYPVIATTGNRAGFDGERFYVPQNLTSVGIKHALIQVYRLIAKKLIRHKVAHFAGLMKVSPAAVKINGAKTRWGSCSGKNNLNFSWMLVMGTDNVIDYVVVHELAHIREHNHSKRFWATVEMTMPDYKQRKQELKTLQERLHVEDWN